MNLMWLGAIPFLALGIGMPFLNHVEPFVFGLPLPLAWTVACGLLSTLVLAIIFVLDPANRKMERRP